MTRLAKVTANLSIEDFLVRLEGIHFFFDGPVLAPTLVPGSEASRSVSGDGADSATYASAETSYKHYLHNVIRVLEEAESLVALRVHSGSDSDDEAMEGDDVDDLPAGVVPRWAAAAAEGLATLLASLQSNPALEELHFLGSYGRRLAFPAPDGGSWVEPGIDSFGRAFLSLLHLNPWLKKVSIGHLAEWCRPSPGGDPGDPGQRPPLPADAEVIFSESGLTDLAFVNVTLHPADDSFFSSVVAHSGQLACLSIRGCKFNDGLVAALVGALPACPSLRELRIEDWPRGKMTDEAFKAFGRALPKCRLETLVIYDGDGTKGVARGDELNICSHEGLVAVLEGLEDNTTLCTLDISPVEPCHFLLGELYAGPGARPRSRQKWASAKIESMEKDLEASIAKELAINADPEKRACDSIDRYHIYPIHQLHNRRPGKVYERTNVHACVC